MINQTILLIELKYTYIHIHTRDRHKLRVTIINANALVPHHSLTSLWELRPITETWAYPCLVKRPMIHS